MSDIESLASSLAESALHSQTPSHHHPRSLHERHASKDDNFAPHENTFSGVKSEREKAGTESTKTKQKFPNKKTSNVSAELPQRSTSLKSRQSICSARSSGRVLKTERRGLLSTFTIIPEYYDPRTYRPSQKLTVVLIVAFAAVSGPMGTTILLPAVKDLSSDLNTNLATVNISVGIYLLSLGIFPMWWTNFSEKHGRRSVYVISFAWFFAFSIACAVAPSISTLIAFRLLAGVGASAVQSCGAGTISDLYIQEERGTALGLFYLGPLLGPFLSPIIGGAVAEAWGWRASMWIMVIVCGLNLVSIVFLLPETLPRDNAEAMRNLVRETLAKDGSDGGKIDDDKSDDDRIDDEKDKDNEDDKSNRDMDEDNQHGKDHSTENDPALHSSLDLERAATYLSQSSSLRRQVLDEPTPVDVLMPTLSRLTTNQSSYSRRIREQQLARAENASSFENEKSWYSHAYDYVVRPMHALVLLTYPPALLAIAYCAIGSTGIYFLNITISNAYASSPYNFSSVIVGLMYIPNSITFILTSIYGGRWNDWLIKRSARKHNGELRPEFRLSWNIVLAAILYPPACLIFGWCIDKKQHWVTPLVGSALLGISSMLIMGSTITYLVDLLPGKGATGVALNNLTRQILAATATFVTEPAVSHVGAGVLFSIYAGVVSVAVLFVVLLKKNGDYMRERYDITTYYAKL